MTQNIDFSTCLDIMSYSFVSNQGGVMSPLSLTLVSLYFLLSFVCTLKIAAGRKKDGEKSSAGYLTLLLFMSPLIMAVQLLLYLTYSKK